MQLLLDRERLLAHVSRCRPVLALLVELPQPIAPVGDRFRCFCAAAGNLDRLLTDRDRLGQLLRCRKVLERRLTPHPLVKGDQGVEAQDRVPVIST